MEDFSFLDELLKEAAPWELGHGLSKVSALIQALAFQEAMEKLAQETLEPTVGDLLRDQVENDRRTKLEDYLKSMQPPTSAQAVAPVLDVQQSQAQADQAVAAIRRSFASQLGGQPAV